MTDYVYGVISHDGVVENIVAADNPDIAFVLKEMIPEASDVVLVTELTGAACIGGDFIDGRFRPLKPYPSWVWDESSFSWVTPIPYPNDGNGYIWDEASVSWLVIPPLPVEQQLDPEE